MYMSRFSSLFHYRYALECGNLRLRHNNKFFFCLFRGFKTGPHVVLVVMLYRTNTVNLLSLIPFTLPLKFFIVFYGL
ncbi:unnamed protein product [Ixodes pacificus]